MVTYKIQAAAAARASALAQPILASKPGIPSGRWVVVAVLDNSLSWEVGPYINSLDPPVPHGGPPGVPDPDEPVPMEEPPRPIPIPTDPPPKPIQAMMMTT